MKKAVLILVIMVLSLVNNVTGAQAEVLLWENLETKGGMNYFESEVVNATTNDYLVEVFDTDVMATIRPALRWRWVRDDANADWSYSSGHPPVVGARLADGHNPTWDLLEVQYKDEYGNFVAFKRQAVAFDEQSATKFYGGVNFRRIYFATTKEYNVVVESKFGFTISIFDEDGNARLTEREVVDGSILLGDLTPGDIITVTPFDGENEGLSQSYTFE